MTLAGKFRVLLAALFAVVLVGCLGPAPRLDSTAGNTPLQIFLSSVVDSTGSLRPFVEVAVPRRALVFQSKDGVILGGLEITVTAWRDDRQLNGDVAKNLVTIPDWQAAKSDSLVRCSLSFTLPGREEAMIRVQARSWGTRRSWQRDLVYRPAEWLRLPLAFSRFQWNLADPPETGQGCDSLVISLAIKSLAKSGQDVVKARMGLTFTDASGDRVLSLERPLAGPSGLDKSWVQEFHLTAADLPFGYLEATPFLAGPGEGTDEILRPWLPGWSFANFQVDWGDETAWQDQMNWLEGKISPELVAVLLAAPPEDRQDAWQEAWRPQCSACDDQEIQDTILAHWRLINAADRKFSGSQPGSHSDQGRAYIRYGPPDSIDLHWDDRERHGRWETWSYEDSGLQLIFFDPHGLGEYRLVDTLPAP